MNTWDATLILPYFRLKLATLLDGNEDLTATLRQEPPPNLSLLSEMHPYQPQEIANKILDRLQFVTNHKAWQHYSSDFTARRIAVQEKIIREKSLFWLQEFQNDRQCRYFLLQAPYELAHHEQWQQSIVISLSQAFGGTGYHDYDTGKIPEEYRFIEPAVKNNLIPLLVCLTFDDPWWDDELVLQRDDIDRIANMIIHFAMPNPTAE